MVIKHKKLVAYLVKDFRNKYVKINFNSKVSEIFNKKFYFKNSRKEQNKIKNILRKVL